MVSHIDYHNCDKLNCFDCEEYNKCYGIEENENIKNMARERRELKAKKKKDKDKDNAIKE
jgi:hypothetical protein